MQLNLTKPLQILQWSSYAYLLVLVKIFVIFPIAILLFNDFYLRLLPSDSSQWVNLSKLQTQKNDLSSVEFFQTIERIPIDSDIPALLDNGLAEGIPLRDHISYKMDLDMNFFCKFSSKSQGYTPSGIVEMLLQVYSTHKTETLIFQRTMPVLCMTIDDSIIEEELYKQGPSRLALYQKEWSNRIAIHDKIDINPRDLGLKHVWTLKSPGSRLIFNPESGFRFRMSFEQGLRNMMLRWHKITYIVGIIVFDCAISTLFVMAVLVSFYFMSNKLKGGTKRE